MKITQYRTTIVKKRQVKDNATSVTANQDTWMPVSFTQRQSSYCLIKHSAMC